MRAAADGTYTPISGATAASYTPVSGDVGNYLKATASYTDSTGSDSAEQVSDNAVVADTAGTVALSATQPEMGIPLTATLTDADGEITGTTWQWSSSDIAGGTFTDISGATAATYRPAEADLEKYLQATATYTDSLGSGKSASETTTSAVIVEERSFLDNIGQLSMFSYRGDPGIASRFRTGGHPAGYKLSEIRITLAGGTTYSQSSVAMHVYSARSNGYPNRSIFQMVGPDTFMGWTVFDAPVGARLEPNTTYYAAMVSDSQQVICSGAHGNRYGSGRASDWSAEKAYGLDSQGNWDSFVNNEGCGIRIRGEAAIDTSYVKDLEITSSPADTNGYIVGETLRRHGDHERGRDGGHRHAAHPVGRHRRHDPHHDLQRHGQHRHRPCVSTTRWWRKTRTRTGCPSMQTP